jgi:hypothetical protein
MQILATIRKRAQCCINSVQQAAKFHSDIATCRMTLFLLIVKEILLVLFIITNFRVAHKMLCTPWLRNPLTISRLSCLGRKAALATVLLSVRQSTISHP